MDIGIYDDTKNAFLSKDDFIKSKKIRKDSYNYLSFFDEIFEKYKYSFRDKITKNVLFRLHNKEDDKKIKHHDNLQMKFSYNTDINENEFKILINDFAINSKPTFLSDVRLREDVKILNSKNNFQKNLNPKFKENTNNLRIVKRENMLNDIQVMDVAFSIFIEDEGHPAYLDDMNDCLHINPFEKVFEEETYDKFIKNNFVKNFMSDKKYYDKRRDILRYAAYFNKWLDNSEISSSTFNTNSNNFFHFCCDILSNNYKNRISKMRSEVDNNFFEVGKTKFVKNDVYHPKHKNEAINKFIFYYFLTNLKTNKDPKKDNIIVSAGLMLGQNQVLILKDTYADKIGYLFNKGLSTDNVIVKPLLDYMLNDDLYTLVVRHFERNKLLKKMKAVFLKKYPNRFFDLRQLALLKVVYIKDSKFFTKEFPHKNRIYQTALLKTYTETFTLDNYGNGWLSFPFFRQSEEIDFDYEISPGGLLKELLNIKDTRYKYDNDKMISVKGDINYKTGIKSLGKADQQDSVFYFPLIIRDFKKYYWKGPGNSFWRTFFVYQDKDSFMNTKSYFKNLNYQLATPSFLRYDKTDLDFF